MNVLMFTLVSGPKSEEILRVLQNDPLVHSKVIETFHAPPSFIQGMFNIMF